jgi:uncharacterized membrane protein YdjX (TVP38/TMEM64 family)
LKLATAVALGILAIIFLLGGKPSVQDVEGFRGSVLSFGSLGIVFSAGFMLIQATFAPNVTIVTNALVFGPFWGGLLSWVTILMGASVCFWFSRKYGKPMAARLAGRSLESVERFLERYGLHALLLARITPFVPFDAVSYVAGLAGVSYRKFLLATAIGLAPLIAFDSYIGSVAFKNVSFIGLSILIVMTVCGWLTVRYLRKAADARLVPVKSRQ